MAIKTKRLGADNDINYLNRVKVRNKFWDPTNPNTALPKGSVVYASGIQGVTLEVQYPGALMTSADGFMMVVLHDIEQDGHATTGWFIKDLDTSAGAVGDPIYLDSNGEVALAGSVQCGHILSVSATEGKVLIDPRMV